MTPAILVIFVGFRGLRRGKPLVFVGGMSIVIFSLFFVKNTCFRQGAKPSLSKNTVFTTLRIRFRENLVMALRGGMGCQISENQRGGGGEHFEFLGHPESDPFLQRFSTVTLV